VIELLLVANLEQLGRKLHLLSLVKDLLQFAGEFELFGFELSEFRVAFELRAIDVMHDVLRASRGRNRWQRRRSR
jgi:hypothetical protein